VKPEPSQNLTEEDCQDPSAPEQLTAESSSDVPPTNASRPSENDGKPTPTTTLNTSKKGRPKKRPKKYVVKEDYIDIIKDAFWESKPWILS
jgi:hypothetical protein